MIWRYRNMPPFLKGVIFIEEKVLLSVKEVMEYTGLGESSVRKILNTPKNKLTVRIGNRLYAHRRKLDEWLLRQIQD